MTDKNKQYLKSEPFKGRYPANNMKDLLKINAVRFRDKVVYYFLKDGENETDRITYGQMETKAKAIAATLQFQVHQGDRALMLFPPGIEFIVSLFGCFFAGVIGVPAYPPRKNRLIERFEAIVKDSDPAVILTTQKILNDLRKNFPDEDCLSSMRYVVYEDVADDLASEWKNPEIFPEDLALLQYTSGSTGSPNGVMVSHGNMVHNSEFIKQVCEHDDNLIFVSWLPGFHDMGLVGSLIQPVYVGGTNVIIPPNIYLLKPMTWLKAISKYRATMAGGPNFALDYCVDRLRPQDLDGVDLSTIYPFFCGAEPIRKKTLDRFAATFKLWNFSPKQFYPCYGLAESVLIVTGVKLKNEPIILTVDSRAIEKGFVVPVPETHEAARPFVSCGFPRVGTKVAIVDPETFAVCEEDRIGEIWTSGPSVAQGYWNKPDETQITFKAFLSDTGEGPFLRTGDLGFIHDGNLYISGRIKDLIIIRGLNHYPQDIERTVESSHEALSPGAGAAFSVDIQEKESLVVIQEVKRTFLRDLTVDKIFEAIRENIMEVHLLQVYSIVLLKPGSIPKTSSGKTQRYACRKDYLEGKLEVVAKWQMQTKDGTSKRET
jgi:acyl-CoA synthetase (AMP-forming)/AMP-acid ligase II